MENNDTIAAISTPHGEGGIGIIRISGDKAFPLADKIFITSKGSNLSSTIKNNKNSHKVLHGYIKDPDSGHNIDEVILLIMPRPHTYTCEDIVEINCHGGVFLLNKILSIVMRCGARLAEPGEFTKRAFLNGRIDLIKAESVIDMIKAESDSELTMAFSQLEGRLSEALSHLTDKLVDISARLEAAIDFPEEDLELTPSDKIKSDLTDVIRHIDSMIDGFFAGRILKNGVTVVVAGRPNVGKSSLLNELLMEERAIVTPHPGTTRDIIEGTINISGIKFKIKDTAGIRDASHEIEEEGIRRGREAARSADIVIIMIDGSEGLTEEDISCIKEIENKNIIVVSNKSDIGDKLSQADLKKAGYNAEAVKISAKAGRGIDTLKKRLIAMHGANLGDNQPSPIICRLRHKELLDAAKENLTTALFAVDKGLSPEFIAIDISSAINSIGKITGEDISEEVMNKIFSEFCIGK